MKVCSTPEAVSSTVPEQVESRRLPRAGDAADVCVGSVMGNALCQRLSRAPSFEADAGASGFFAPALVDEVLIEDLCDASSLPVNIMAMKSAPDAATLGQLGVARISHGPGPYRAAMASLKDAAAAVYG